MPLEVQGRPLEMDPSIIYIGRIYEANGDHHDERMRKWINVRNGKCVKREMCET